MAGLLQQLIELANMARLRELAMSFGYAMLVPVGFLLAVYLLEKRAGVNVARYRTRNFANDVVYMIFYNGGFFQVLLLAATTNVLEARLGFLQVDFMQGVPWPVGLAIFWVVGDLITYWWHRLQHSNRFLWAFHSVHHSQEQLNLFTASRRHPVEQLMMIVLLYFFTFHLVLGIPTQGWLPLSAFVTTVVWIQHAQLDWRFGPLYRVFVSPRFHAFHHSVQPDHANANYGHLFSIWDYLFGTAVREQPLPARYGLMDGTDMAESIKSHLITPFRLLWRWRRRVDPAPGTEVSTDPQ